MHVRKQKLLRKINFISFKNESKVKRLEVGMESTYNRSLNKHDVAVP